MALRGFGQSPRKSFDCGRSRIEAATIRGHTAPHRRGRTPQWPAAYGLVRSVNGGMPMTGKTMTGKEAGIAVAALCGALATAAPALAQNEQFIPSLVYRTGAYAPNGVPFANGIADYYTLVNERDGGINGVKIVFEECDTGYA